MRTRPARLLSGMLALLTLAGCSATSVRVEHDPTASFAGLSTYSWAAAAQPVTNDPRLDNPILDARIRRIVEAELAARGFEKQTAGAPELLLLEAAACLAKAESAGKFLLCKELSTRVPARING